MWINDIRGQARRPVMFSAKHVKGSRSPSQAREVRRRARSRYRRIRETDTSRRRRPGKTYPNSTARLLMAAVLEMIKRNRRLRQERSRDSCKCIIFYPDGIVEQQKQETMKTAQHTQMSINSIMLCGISRRLFCCPSYASSDSQPEYL